MPITTVILQASPFSPLSVATLSAVIAASVALAVWLARLDDEWFDGAGPGDDDREEQS